MGLGKLLDGGYQWVFTHWQFVQFCFIAAYALEQLVLIFAIYSNYEKGLVVSLFAVIVLATFTVQELLMKIRMGEFEKAVYELQLDKQDLTTEVQRIKEEYDRIVTAYNRLAEGYNSLLEKSNSLNKRTPS